MAKGQSSTSHPRFRDLSDQTFGRLRVQSLAGVKNGRCVWRCLCDCGGVAEIVGGYLTSKTKPTRSCGCLKREANAERLASLGSRHGRCGTPEYRSWQAMLSRCYKRSDVGFANYGGRGIAVCDRWRSSFAAFFADVGEKPTPAHSLDRIDTNGNYEPANCRWATDHEQHRNRRDNVWLTLDGVTRCITEWAAMLGVDRGTIRGRLKKGWTLERALTTPAIPPHLRREPRHSRL